MEALMKEQIDSDITNFSGKGRSPQCPCIGLEEAVNLLRLLHGVAKTHEVLIEGVASGAWNSNILTAKRFAGSLEHFGLAERNKGKSKGKIKISSRGMTVLVDVRPGERNRALAAAAVQHPLLNEYIQKWGITRPQDNICMSELQIEKFFTESGAKEFLKVYDGTVKYALDQQSNTNSSFQLHNDLSGTNSFEAKDSVENAAQRINHATETSCNKPDFSNKNPRGVINQIFDLLEQLNAEDKNIAIRWIQNS
jgi:hypothetical protein